MDSHLPDFPTLLPNPGIWDFFLVRHGESEGNKAGIIQGRKEYDLTQKGMQQALALGQWIDAPDVIISSPMSRAFVTAQIIAKEKGIALKKILKVPELTEVDTGPFTGKTPEALKETMPELWKAFRLHSWQAVEGAESQSDLRDRASICWTQICQVALDESLRQSKGSLFQQILKTFGRTSPNQDQSPQHIKVLAVTHSGLLQWLFRNTFHVPLAPGFPSIKASNCGVFLFRIRREKDLSGELGYSSEWRMINYLPYQ